MVSSNTVQKQKSIAPEDQSVTYKDQDGITSLSWSPTNNHLASGNWDGNVSIWLVEKHNGGTIRFKEVMQYHHDGPVLDVCWSPDGATVFSGGCDNRVLVAPLGQKTVALGSHNKPVKAVRYCQKHSCIVSGSWDGTVKFWQIGNPSPLATLQFPDRVYGLDVRGEVMVVGLANRSIVVHDLSGHPREVSRETSPLPHQTREIAVFPDATGYAVGDLGGRVGIQYFDANKKSKNFFYMAHCDGKENGARANKTKLAYSVNSIAFHKTPGIIASAGSDGAVIFGDIYNKKITKRFPKIERTIPACAFNKDGDLFAYASSYDWSQGKAHAQPDGNEIFVHCVHQDTVKPKPKKN